MSASSVEPMRKPSRERDFDKAGEVKARRFKKQNIKTDKREAFFRDGMEKVHA